MLGVGVGRAVVVAGGWGGGGVERGRRVLWSYHGTANT